MVSHVKVLRFVELNKNDNDAVGLFGQSEDSLCLCY